MDPYSPCFCGSGKKFKWCCQDIYVEVNQAFEKEKQKQHQVARQMMEKVVSKNPGNPQAWCFQAQMLLTQGEKDEAEKALDKALELSAEHPFALLLQATVRLEEGEHAGALILARRAANSYDPNAKDALGEVYDIIYGCEMQRNNPVAAYAALRILIRCDPGNSELRQALQMNFKEGRFPAAVSKDYAFQSPEGDVAEDRRKQWDEALKSVSSPRFQALADAFEALAQSDPGDKAAWHNLGMARAWLGENEKAIEALNRYVELEQDENKAAEIATLTLVLYQGNGMGEKTDYSNHFTNFEITDPQPLQPWLQGMVEDGRLQPLNDPREQGYLTALLREPIEERIVTTSASPAKEYRISGFLTSIQNIISLASSTVEKLEKIKSEFRDRVGLAVSESTSGVVPLSFQDIMMEGVVFPRRGLSNEEAEKRLEECLQQHYEGPWLRRSFKYLSNNSPIDAAQHPVFRKRLRGLVTFLEQCARMGPAQVYDYNRLRRKLGLLEGEAAPVVSTTESTEGAESPAGATKEIDIDAMGAAELGQLSVEDLSDAQLEMAFRAAKRLDASELSHHFAKTLVGRPTSDGTDRFPIFSALIQHAMQEGNLDEALDHVNEGERIDCEHNEGRQRNAYELKRAQVHAKRGEGSEAHDVFKRLIERDPSNMDVHVRATEAMLSLKKGKEALEMAEAGLTEARRQNDGDSEGHFMELQEAAERLANG